VRIDVISLADLAAVLVKNQAKLEAHEVHALYLGALTSTNPRLGPQSLLGHIFGEQPVLGDSIDDANASLRVIFGYWNTLVARREAGLGVSLAPFDLPEAPTRDELRDFAKRRHDEIAWFVRGIDAGDDHPVEFGSEGERLLTGIAQGSGFLNAYVELLERDTPVEPKELENGRATLLTLVETMERLISDLMEVSDAVRREAMETFTKNAGAPTDDGGRVASIIKVGRNELCPCGSGKKYKRCCGDLAKAH
jgi:hypothetical protein